jgi:adenylate cyclase
VGQEIERKFLVDPEKLGNLGEGESLQQGYVATAGSATVRLRVAGERAWLTLKGPTVGTVRSEFEYPVPPADARAMIAELCDGPLIVKTRYRREHAGHTWEIDVFEGHNSGLVLAEVELEQADEAVELPDWITVEVSGDPRYFNSYLARHPWPTWGRD